MSRTLFRQLQEIHGAISDYVPIPPISPPILDSTQETLLNPNTDFDTDRIVIPGLKALKDAIRRDLDILAKYVSTLPTAADESDFEHEQPPPSTNAPYLIAVGRSVLHARSPVAIFKSVSIVPVTISSKRGGGRPRDDDDDDESSGGDAQEPRPKGRRRGKGRRGNHPRPQKQPGSCTKIDVVADAGRTWIRVNTIKTIRLLAEFREIDSYLTDSSSASDCEEPGYVPTLAQKTFDNSILRMGRQLVAAARVSVGLSPTDTGPHLGLPKVVMRLTRLEVSTDGDLRIPLTIKLLEEMGIVVEVESRMVDKNSTRVDEPTVVDVTDTAANSSTNGGTSIQKDKPLPIPTLRVNLDLSVLIALVSDLTHAPLPTSVDDVPKVFTSEYDTNAGPSRYEIMYPRAARPVPETADTNTCIIHDSDATLPQKTSTDTNGTTTKLDGETTKPPVVGYGNGETEHMRALTTQLLQEMGRGMLDELRDRLALDYDDQPGQQSPRLPSAVQFWTTREARNRCLRIVAKIGGASEQRRLQALFFSPSSQPDHQEQRQQEKDTYDAQTAYWKDSRYPQGHVPLLPVRVFEEDEEDVVASEAHKAQMRTSRNPSEAFFAALESTCLGITQSAEESIGRRSVRTHHTSGEISTNSTIAKAEEEEYVDSYELGSRPKHTNVARLTQHTAISLLYGSERRITTLTANRASVKAIVKEMRVGRGFGAGGRGWRGLDDADEEVVEEEDGGEQSTQREVAAIWVVDPRSLAEGMRVC